VARHILTLPTHPFVTSGDVSRMIAAIARTAEAPAALGVCALP
jgi:hypothetical protein